MHPPPTPQLFKAGRMIIFTLYHLTHKPNEREFYDFLNDFLNDFQNDYLNDYSNDFSKDFSNDYSNDFSSDFSNDYSIDFSNYFSNVQFLISNDLFLMSFQSR